MYIDRKNDGDKLFKIVIMASMIVILLSVMFRVHASEETMLGYIENRAVTQKLISDNDDLRIENAKIKNKYSTLEREYKSELKFKTMYKDLAQSF